MRTKKADVAEHSKVFDHVGLLLNQPPDANRAAFLLVVRRPREATGYRLFPDPFTLDLLREIARDNRVLLFW